MFSCFANTLCDKVRATKKAKTVRDVLAETLDEFANQIANFCDMNQDKMVIIAIPLERYRPKWFTDVYRTIVKKYRETFRSLSCRNLRLMPAFSEELQMNDQVHLIPPQGKIYINFLVTESRKIYAREGGQENSSDSQDQAVEVVDADPPGPLNPQDTEMRESAAPCGARYSHR